MNKTTTWGPPSKPACLSTDDSELSLTLEVFDDGTDKPFRSLKCLPFSIRACHPCVGARLISSTSFQV